MYVFNVAFWGDAQVEKTNLVRSLKGKSDRQYFSSKLINELIQYDLWDVTWLKERNNTILKRCELGLYCFNASQPVNEETIKEEIALFKLLNPKASVIVIGTHLDYCNDNHELIQSLTKELHPVEVMFTSANTGEGIQALKNHIELEIDNQIAWLDLSVLLQKINPQSNFYKAFDKFHILVYSQLSNSKQKEICLETLQLFRQLSSEISDSLEKRASIVSFVANCKTHLGIIEEEKAYQNAIGVAVGIPLVLFLLVGISIYFTFGLAAVPLGILIFVGAMQLLGGLLLWGTLATNYGDKELDKLESELIEDFVEVQKEKKLTDYVSSHLRGFIDFKNHALAKKNKDPENSKSLQLAKDLCNGIETADCPQKVVTAEIKQRMDQCRFFKQSTARLLVDNLSIYDHPKIFL
jgi:hypothetical protein